MAESALCGRCGAALAANTQFCTQCGAPRARRATLPQAALQDRARRARFSQLALATFLDVVLLAMLLVALAFIGLAANDVNVWVACALVLAVAAAAHLAALLCTGQSLSARLVGIRLISGVTGSAPGARLTSLRFVDVRGGEDPVDPQMAPFEVSLAVHDVARGEAALPPHRRGWMLVIDEERRIALTGAFVVGRNPAVLAGETAVAIDDLGRMLSKAHLRFDLDADGTIFVTDLNSTNGSHIGSEALAPFQPVAITQDTRIQAGDHAFRVENRARVLHGAHE